MNESVLVYVHDNCWYVAASVEVTNGGFMLGDFSSSLLLMFRIHDNGIKYMSLILASGW